MKISLEITDEQVAAYCSLQNRIDEESDEDFVQRKILEPFVNAEREYIAISKKEELDQNIEAELASREKASISFSK